MNWKNYVEKQNEKTYVLPPDWDTREGVAEQLECSVERVGELLRPGIKSGDIETQQFPVWDSMTRRVVRVIAYRRRPDGAAKTPTPVKASAWTGEEVKRARDLRKAGKSWNETAKLLGRTRAAVKCKLR